MLKRQSTAESAPGRRDECQFVIIEVVSYVLPDDQHYKNCVAKLPLSDKVPKRIPCYLTNDSPTHAERKQAS